MSHGRVDRHIQVSLHPSINHSTFNLYSGFGQNLFPIVSLGGAGVIDGLAAFFPKTVVALYKLSSTLPITEEAMSKIRELQFAVSCAEELVGAHGITGIKEAVFRVLGMGDVKTSRLPIRARLTEDEWKVFEADISRCSEIENGLKDL
jgi:2-keto-3-deoxy-L-rhamnonate aldolase